MTLKTIVFLFGVLTNLISGIPLLTNHKPFIIGGVDAPVAYAPHMAALVFGDKFQRLMCGGSIISRTLVLTAAHCVAPMVLEDGELSPTFRALVGSNQWNSGGILAEIKKYYMHPQWNPKTFKFDAAVLVLREELVLTEYVGIIELAYEFVEGNEMSFVTGWGITGPRIDGDVVHLAPTPDDLQLLYVNTLSHQQCQEQMTLVAGDIAPPIQRDIEICTFHSYQHGMCSGDSGSALVRNNTNQQIGIVSWGLNCANGAPDVFVRIYGIKNFLEPIMNTYL